MVAVRRTRLPNPALGLSPRQILYSGREATAPTHTETLVLEFDRLESLQCGTTNVAGTRAGCTPELIPVTPVEVTSDARQPAADERKKEAQIDHSYRAR